MRPTVTLICPFRGTDAELRAAETALARVDLRDGDELLIEDNRGQPASSYFARQQAATRARTDWLVFVDADTRPAPGLLDAYFDPLPADDVAVLAGGIDDTVVQDTLVARYIAARAKLDQGTTLARGYGQTANLAVRRAAFERVGGWPEPIRSGGDADLCWRLAAAGWRLESRPGARVAHSNRSTATALLRQLHRHGSGMAWLNERWPGSFPPPTARELAGRLKLATSVYGALDVLGLYASDLGRLRANR